MHHRGDEVMKEIKAEVKRLITESRSRTGRLYNLVSLFPGEVIVVNKVLMLTAATIAMRIHQSL